MARQVFVDIDTQADFINDDGALAVPGAMSIRDNLQKLTQYALAHHIPIIASADAHPRDDKEFEIFPPHCVQDTPGQKKIPETCAHQAATVKNAPFQHNLQALIDKTNQIVLEKQTFDVFSNPNTAALLKAINADEHIVYGVATDYCVKAAALSLLDAGYNVTVVSDAIAAVSEEGGKEAIALMRENGAVFKRTQEIIGR